MLHERKIGVVVPAYNEEKLIVTTLMGIPSFVDTVVVVDDKSQDSTVNKIKEYLGQEQNNRIVLLSHEKNQGVGSAIITGLKHCISEECDIFTVMAGDNQMDADYLEALIMPIIENKADFTKGNRLAKNFWKGMSVFRYIGNKILSLLTNIVSGYWNIQDPQNGYVAFSKSCLDSIDLDKLEKRYQFENDIMIKTNVFDIRMKNVLIPARYGDETSHINYFTFIFKTSFFLIYSFLWRIWNKYMKRFTFIGMLYYFNLVLLIAGIVRIFFNSFVILIIAVIMLPTPILIELTKSKLENKDPK